jgi:DNA-binding XRE family transcriptional regulator
VPLPKSQSFPNALSTIGDHIRAWRLNSHLTQADVAKRLSVCEDTIVGWETRGVVPVMRQIPGIISIIKYLPVQIGAATLGGRVSYYRFKCGTTVIGLSIRHSFA